MSTPARDAAAFEAFYDATRNRLLMQTWALTGDLPAAQKAVRDAFVVAAHHWRKVRRLPVEGAEEVREDWVRPLAWSRARRRHTVPHRRAKGLAPEIATTLTALGRLSITQREVLVLAHLSSVSLDQLAREVGITKSRAERELQTGTAQFSRYLDVPSANVITAFEPMAAAVAEQAWPSAARLARHGASRRRTHTAAGVLIAAAALVGSGLFAAHQSDSSPTLGALSFHRAPSDQPTSHRDPSYPLDSGDLLTPSTVGSALSGRWRTDVTSDTRSATASSVPCEPQRLAGASARAALSRSFDGPGKTSTSAESVVAEDSADSARRHYDRTLQAYVTCDEPRLQLVDTRRARGIGDAATLMSFRDHDQDRTLVFGLARSGSVLTGVQAAVAQQPDRALPRAQRLLQRALARSCRLPGGDHCVSKPTSRAATPLPVGSHPDLLSVIDLPAVGGVDAPWAGTKPESATDNLAATRCDNTRFRGHGLREALTRTFVIPDAHSLSKAFGLTETAGSFRSTGAARSFARSVQDRIDGCGKRLLGSDVSTLTSTTSTARDLHAWDITVETGKNSSFTYLMAIVRQGDAVAQVGFVPSGKATVSRSDFRALATRTAQRLELG